MDFEVREMRPAERGLLESFLYECIFVPDGAQPPPRDITSLPELRVYTEEFGSRGGDEAFVALVSGKVVGVAWARIMNDYGHIDDETPSLAISVLAPWRGQGAGKALMDALLEKLREDGYKSASLSVQKANRACHLYERLGFQPVEGVGPPDADDWIMLLSLAQDG